MTLDSFFSLILPSDPAMWLLNVVYGRQSSCGINGCVSLSVALSA